MVRNCRKKNKNGEKLKKKNKNVEKWKKEEEEQKIEPVDGIELSPIASSNEQRASLPFQC